QVGSNFVAPHRSEKQLKLSLCAQIMCSSTYFCSVAPLLGRTNRCQSRRGRACEGMGCQGIMEMPGRCSCRALRPAYGSTDVGGRKLVCFGTKPPRRLLPCVVNRGRRG